MTTTIDEIEGLLARATMDLSRPWSQVAHYELALALRAAAPDLIAVVRAALNLQPVATGWYEATGTTSVTVSTKALGDLMDAATKLGVKP